MIVNVFMCVCVWHKFQLNLLSWPMDGQKRASSSHASAFVADVESAWNMHNAKHAKTKYQQPKPITKKKKKKTQGVKENKQWVNVIKKWKIALSLRVYPLYLEWARRDSTALIKLKHIISKLEINRSSRKHVTCTLNCVDEH